MDSLLAWLLRRPQTSRDNIYQANISRASSIRWGWPAQEGQQVWFYKPTATHQQELTNADLEHPETQLKNVLWSSIKSTPSEQGAGATLAVYLLSLVQAIMW